MWLAQQGLDVLSVDQSPVGLRKAQELAKSRGVSLRTEQADLTAWSWPKEAFDIVAAIFVHFRPEQRAQIHMRMYAALKPGGVLILEAFTPMQLKYKSGGPQDPEALYTADMLRREFSAGEILLLEEMLAELSEGSYHHGTSAIVRLVLRRPGREEAGPRRKQRPGNS